MTVTETAQALAPADHKHQLVVSGIHKSFGEHHVLRGIDLQIERGKINVVIGGSGAGKSVLMKHLVGLLKPDQGSILVDGEDLVPMNEFQLNKVRGKFGMLFQYSALFDSMTVEENVMFPLIEHRRGQMSRAQMRDHVRAMLHSLDLYGTGKKYPAEISGGMRKRVGLARAIILEPEILFYDEPTTGLDPIATKNVDGMIADISSRLGVTSVVISHDMASTFRIGHRVSMLYKGRIIASGTPREILKHPDPNLREFLSTSKAVEMLPPDGEPAEAAR